MTLLMFGVLLLLCTVAIMPEHPVSADGMVRRHSLRQIDGKKNTILVLVRCQPDESQPTRTILIADVVKEY